MASTACKNCGQSISGQAASCPGCGHPNKARLSPADADRAPGALLLLVLLVSVARPTAIPALALGLFFLTLGVTAAGLIRPRWSGRRFARRKVVGVGAAVAFACLALAVWLMPPPEAGHEMGAVAGAWMTLAVLGAIALPISAWIQSARERRARAQG